MAGGGHASIDAAAGASRRWQVDPCRYAELRGLVDALGLSETVAAVLVRRGLSDPDQARHFLDADERHDPSRMPGVDGAVASILAHVKRGGPIAVHGDYDVDGVCSTAVMVRALRELGAEVIAHLPSRHDDGYGLSVSAIERLRGQGASLLVTTDCGIGAVEEVAHARGLGIDVVVTDHHLPGDDLPACPIVHPALGEYPWPELCATAVAHKLARVLYERAGLDPVLLDRELDLVALATVADVMPLMGENRALVREGLRVIAGAGRPGLRALLRVAGVDPQSATEYTLGFVMGPRINAAGRLYRADASLELLLTPDDDRALEIARELDAINRERQSVETEILFEAERVLSQSGRRDDSALVIAGQGWHSGVIGIVASRLVERYHRPCVLIAFDPDGHGKGSGRSIRVFDLHAGLEACASHLSRFGGHRMAAGLELEAASLDRFREAFVAHASERIAPEDLVRSERVDAVVPGDMLTLDLAEELESLRPFGMGNPSVSLMVPAAQLSDVRPMGEGRHSRFTLTSGGARSRVVAFGGGRSPGGVSIDRGNGERRFDVVARLERNEWQGAVEPRLVLRSLHEVSGAGDDDVPGGCDNCAHRATGSDWWRSVLRELDAPLEEKADLPDAAMSARTIVDRRGAGVFGALAALATCGEAVAIACADVSRRRVALERALGIERFSDSSLGALSERCAEAAHEGFERAWDDGILLTDHATLVRHRSRLGRFEHLFLLDPPRSGARLEALTDSGRVGRTGFVHLGWGAAEVQFASRALEAEFSLRESLRAIYAELRRGPEGLSGPALEAALAGPGEHSRKPTVVGRCLRVLEELGLVGIDRSSGTVRCTITEGKQVELEASQAFAIFERICREGLGFLSAQTIQRSQERAA
ncbi:MAG: single-stranded-DNA-specific exonuclease RecJ [Solirubrobacterales bacterium]